MSTFGFECVAYEPPFWIQESMLLKAWVTMVQDTHGRNL